MNDTKMSLKARPSQVKRWGQFAALLLALCWTSAAQADLNVVATLPDFGALAAEIGGEHVTIQTLVNPNEDPHYVDPKPSHVVRLNKADMLIANGLELEVGWLPPLQSQARNPKILVSGRGFLDASTCLTKLMEVPVGRITRDQGDIHPGGNPHFIHDPRAMAQIARCIGKRMARQDAELADHYTSRAEALATSLEAFANETRQKFEALEADKRRVITYHRSMVYLVDWLRLQRPVNIEPKPGVPPTPSHTATVLKMMKGQGIDVILQESYYPRKTSDTLAKLGKGQVVVIQAGTSGKQTYLERMRTVTEELYNAMAQ